MLACMYVNVCVPLVCLVFRDGRFPGVKVGGITSTLILGTKLNQGSLKE